MPLWPSLWTLVWTLYLPHPLTNWQTINRRSLHWCVSAAEKSVVHISGQEQKCWRCFGDGLDVLFVVTATVGEHQVIYDSHNTHEWQEEENAFPEQEARSALASLPQVANKVLLPDHKVDNASKGSWSLAEADTSAPQYCQKCGVRVHAVSIRTGQTLKRCRIMFRLLTGALFLNL